MKETKRIKELKHIKKEYINNHLRFSFGWSTGLGEGKKAAEILLNSLEKIS